jgi:hypothetical protein
MIGIKKVNKVIINFLYIIKVINITIIKKYNKYI